MLILKILEGLTFALSILTAMGKAPAIPQEPYTPVTVTMEEVQAP